MASSPARLEKKVEEKSIMAKIELFLNRHVSFLLPMLLVVLLILIIALVLTVIDITSAHNQSMIMVESGNYYNHLQDVI